MYIAVIIFARCTADTICQIWYARVSYTRWKIKKKKQIYLLLNLNYFRSEFIRDTSNKFASTQNRAQVDILLGCPVQTLKMSHQFK